MLFDVLHYVGCVVVMTVVKPNIVFVNAIK